MFFNSYVALDITSNEIRAAAVSLGRIQKWATAPVPAEVVKAGVVREPQTLGVIIDSLFRIYRLSKSRVIVTVTGLPFIYRSVEMPAKQRIQSEAIERESRREMSLSPEDMYISWQQTEKRTAEGEVDYFVVGIPRVSLNPVISALGAAGIKPLSIDIKPLALARAAGRNEAIIVSLEEENVDIVVVARGLVRVIHSFNPGRQSLSTEGPMTEILAGLTRAIKAFERDFPRLELSPETAVLYSGDINSNDPLLEKISEAIGREVEPLSSTLRAPSGMSGVTYAGVLGLVSKKQARSSDGDYRDINIDLLAGFKRAHPSRFQMVFVAAALISLVLAGLVFKSYDLKHDVSLEVAALQEEAAIVSHTLAEAQAVNQAGLLARQESLDRAEAAGRELDSINHLNEMILSRRTDYASRIAAITEAFPAGAYYHKIEFSQDIITITGSAPDGFNVIDMVDRLETSPFFSKVRIDKLVPARDAQIEFKLTVTTVRTATDLSGGAVR